MLDGGVFKKPTAETPKKKNTPTKSSSLPTRPASHYIGKPINCRSHITLNINPMRKPRMTEGDKLNYRDVTQRYWHYKSELNRLAIENNFKLQDIVDVEFHIKMSESWSKKKKERMDGFPHQQTPDIDNLCKAFFDCLKKKDETIWSVRKVKYWDYEGKIIIYT